MIKAIHDVSNRMFRDPAGASQAGSSISLTLLLTQEITDAPVLCVRFDKDASVQQIPMERRSGTDLYTPWSVRFTPADRGLYWYWFELPGGGRIGRDPQSGQAAFTEDPHAWQITVYDPIYQTPDWIRGGVFYHIFVDRFAKGSGEPSIDPAYLEGKILRDDWGGEPIWRPDEHGEILNNDFFGGNLAGIREKLPYLQELGVTCLYLSPIFTAYSSHKYDTADYLQVDPMFGDEAGFTSLCAEAARRGMRVICDGVFSHTGSDSRYFDIHDRYGDGACHHPDSPYRDWYYFEDGSWQSWWGIQTLPRVNKDMPSYQDFIAGEHGVIRHWLRAGASGWRLDVVDELPSSFLEKLTAAAKDEKADAMILGEVWEDASNKIAYDERKNYFEGDKLDSVMNYPLRRGIIDYVREGDAACLAQPMQMIWANYPLRVIHGLMNILGTHDTERILTALAGQRLGPDATRETKAHTHMDASQWAAGIRRLKAAVVLQMTLPGVPCVYYGDEAGMEGYNDPFNRACYPWGHEHPEIQDWYRRVIAIRRAHDVYVDGDYRLLAARDGLFAFARESAGRGVRGAGHGVRAGADHTSADYSTGLGVSDRGETLSDSAPAVCGDTLRTQPASPDDAPISDCRSCLITAVNCGQTQQMLPLFGTWRDLLSGTVFSADILLLPGQAMILQAADAFAPDK